MEEKQEKSRRSDFVGFNVVKESVGQIWRCRTNIRAMYVKGEYLWSKSIPFNSHILILNHDMKIMMPFESIVSFLFEERVYYIFDVKDLAHTFEVI